MIQTTDGKYFMFECCDMNVNITIYEIVVIDRRTYSYHLLSPGTRGTGPERTTTRVFFYKKAAGQE